MSGVDRTYERHFPPEVTIVFYSRRRREDDHVSIVMYRDGVPPDMDPLEGAVLYYVIDSNIASEYVEIRILALAGGKAEARGEIWQWDENERKWVNITQYEDCKNVGHFKLIIGKTPHLSGFGIRT